MLKIEDMEYTVFLSHQNSSQISKNLKSQSSQISPKFHLKSFRGMLEVKFLGGAEQKLSH